MSLSALLAVRIPPHYIASRIDRARKLARSRDQVLCDEQSRAETKQDRKRRDSAEHRAGQR